MNLARVVLIIIEFQTHHKSIDQGPDRTARKSEVCGGLPKASGHPR